MLCDLFTIVYVNYVTIKDSCTTKRINRTIDPDLKVRTENCAHILIIAEVLTKKERFKNRSNGGGTPASSPKTLLDLISRHGYFR